MKHAGQNKIFSKDDLFSLLWPLASLVLITLAIPRGFDFSDEGLYLLLANPRQENIAGVINYDLFFKLFYQFTGLEFGIMGLRILRLVSYFLAAFALTVFWKNLYSKESFQPFIFILALSGLLAGYGFLPQSLSYNSISVVSACFWLALLSKPNLKNFDFLLLGIVFLFLFYSKATVCVILGISTIVYLGYENRLNLLNLFFLILPTLLIELLSFFLVSDSAFLRIIDERSFLALREEYDLFLLFKYTGVGFFWVGIIGFCFFISSRTAKRYPNFQYLAISIAVAILGLIFYSTLITSEWSHIFLLILVAWIAWVLGQDGLESIEKKKRGFFIVLLVLPFAMHFGSNVYWLRLGVHYWVFWVLAASMLVDWKGSRFNSFKIMISLASFLLVLFGLWVTPFEMESNWESTESWTYKHDREILLSKHQVILLKRLLEETKDMKDGEFATLYRNSGLLYLLDFTSPSIPGYWEESQAQVFLKNDPNLKALLVNDLGDFLFPESEWQVRTVLTQPNGDELTIRWER